MPRFAAYGFDHSELAKAYGPRTRARREHAETRLGIAERLGMRPLSKELRALLAAASGSEPQLTEP